MPDFTPYAAGNDVDITGQGPPLLLLHGWPFHKASFRKLVPLLSPYYTCYVPNALGMRDAGFAPGSDFTFAGHAKRAAAFADHQGLKTFHLLAHDTGGTVARILAQSYPKRVEKLILLNTEMPGHRPPFIPFYQKSFALPGTRAVLKALMASPLFLGSSMGFGGCFSDKNLIDDDFIRLFAAHWFETPQRFAGLKAYLRGIDFATVDKLHEIQAGISAPVQIIWGADDVTFPARLTGKAFKSLPNLFDFVPVEQASFLVHEEQPEIVARHVLDFLGCD